MWKNKLMHKHKKYRLLESYFDQFKNEKMGKHSVAASSSAQANNNETV
jgi:hypothetical protein